MVEQNSVCALSLIGRVRLQGWIEYVNSLESLVRAWEQDKKKPLYADKSNNNLVNKWLIVWVIEMN